MVYGNDAVCVVCVLLQTFSRGARDNALQTIRFHGIQIGVTESEDTVY
jgi:hypothetical protein